MSLNFIIISSLKELALQIILCTDHEMVLAGNVMMRMRKFVTTHLESTRTVPSLAACYTKCSMFLVCVASSRRESVAPIERSIASLHRTRETCNLAGIISWFVVCGLTCLK